jgi:hypothetical protein
MGGAHAGWSFYVFPDGQLAFRFKAYEASDLSLLSSVRISPGKHELSARFDYNGNDYGRGGVVTLSIDGKAVASSRIERTVSFLYSLSETFDTGIDTGSPAGLYPEDTLPGFAVSGGQLELLQIQLID